MAMLKLIVLSKRSVANAMLSTTIQPSNVPPVYTAQIAHKMDIIDQYVLSSPMTTLLRHVGCVEIMAISQRHATRSGGITDLSRLQI
jgi:hypothetical protein